MRSVEFINESRSEYLFNFKVNKKLDDLLKNYEKNNKSSSLSEDIDRLSKFCKRYSKEKAIYIYKKLINGGFYIDQFYLLVLDKDRYLKKSLRSLILASLKTTDNSLF